MSRIFQALTQKGVVLVSAVGCSAGAFYLWFDKRPKYVIPFESLEGKTYIVTGANRGIGRETAEALAKKNARVIMACRNKRECLATRREIIRATHNKRVVCRDCDLSSFESIREFADKMIEKEDQIAGIIHNAGMIIGPSHEQKVLTKEGIEAHLGVNHMGRFLLTNLLLKKLIESDRPCRIVNVLCPSLSSYLDSIDFKNLNLEGDTYSYQKAFRQSQLAQYYFTQELARRLEGTHITTNSIDPGLTKSGFDRYMGIEKRWMIMRWYTKILRWWTHHKPKTASAGVLKIATDPDLESSGKHFSQLEPEPVEIKGVEDLRTQLLLWHTSEKWSQLPVSLNQPAAVSFENISSPKTEIPQSGNILGSATNFFGPKIETWLFG